MLYLFHGSDIEKVRRKAFAWVAAARDKEPNLAYVRLSREELTAATLEEAISSGGLFVSRLLVLLDDSFPPTRAVESEEGEGEAEKGGTIVEEYLERIAQSDNAIIMLAPKLPAAKVKKLSAKAKVVYSYDARSIPEEKRGFNRPLVEALASRSREKLWLEINRSLRAGDAPEMLHGLLHWEARDLMEKGGRAWKRSEARQLSLDLIELLQASRRGGLDLSLALEKFALKL